VPPRGIAPPAPLVGPLRRAESKGGDDMLENDVPC